MAAKPQKLLVMSRRATARLLAMPSTRLSAHRRWTCLPRAVLASLLATRYHRSAFRPVTALDANADGVRDHIVCRRREKPKKPQRKDKGETNCWGATRRCQVPDDRPCGVG